jgi:hypothetical protein
MYSLATVLTLAVCSFFSQAAGQSAKEKKGQTVTITGCVTKGESADEFAITQNGKKYGLKTSVIFGLRVNHANLQRSSRVTKNTCT